MGLFGKSKKDLLEWQNLILVSPVNRLVMTEKQLNVQTKPIVDNSIRILNDSAQICNTTKKPDVFFSRYESMIKQAQFLARLSKFIRFEGGHPNEVLKKIINERPMEVHNFINRCLEDVENLKTTSAKAKRYQKLLSDFYPYRSQLDKDNLLYLETTCAQRIEEYSNQKKSGKTNSEASLIKELNTFILQAQTMLGIPYDLTVNPYYTVPARTKITDEPLTKTGRVPKYPKKLHYETPYSENWNLGNIWLLPDGSIGKATAITWINRVGYQIHLAIKDGSLTVNKVETVDNTRNYDEPWKTIYQL